MATSAAIGRSELDLWVSENVEAVRDEEGRLKTKPKGSKWINKNYQRLSEKERTQLEWFTDRIVEADEKYEGVNSLIHETFGQRFINLPGVLKTDAQRLVQGDIGNAIKYQVSKFSEKQKDDFETEDSSKDGLKDSFKRVFADIANREKLGRPTPFRSKLKEGEQSFDLHTIVLMNSIAAENYTQKEDTENTFKLVLEVMKNRKVPLTGALGKKKKIHATQKDPVELSKDSSDGTFNDVMQARNILESRIYGIKSKDSGSIKILGKEADVNQVTKNLLKYAGMTSLVGNIPNSIVNTSMGKINNFIEAMGGEHFNYRDLLKAKKTYWSDIQDVLGDWGSNVDKSRTNMFLNAWNVMGGKEYLGSRFEENTRGQALMKMNTLRPLAKGGEHMMQAQVMYAVMHHIKVMNKDGKWIDSKGKVVSKKKDAASLDEMIEFVPTEDGGIEMILDKNVDATTHTLEGGHSKIMVQTRNLIKYKIRELHGNYDSETQAAAQRSFWGKLAFFLRKWIEEGYFRRWRGIKTGGKKSENLSEQEKFFSQDAKAYREGYYITAYRFIKTTLIPALRQMDMEMIKTGHASLSAHEIANFKKVIAEVTMIALTMMASAMMDDDDEDTVFVRYVLRRQMSELKFFFHPGEAMKIAMTPTAATGVIRNLIATFNQLLSGPGEVYQQGPHKGKRKLTVKALKNVPLVKQTQTDFQSSLNYLNTMAGF